MIFMDLIVIISLAVTVVYCSKLRKKIDNMSMSSDEINEIVFKVQVVVGDARKELRSMERVLSDVENRLKDGLSKAEVMSDDLSFMIKRSDKIAEKLERFISIENRAKSSIVAQEELDLPRRKREPEAALNDHKDRGVTVRDILMQMSSRKYG